MRAMTSSVPADTTTKQLLASDPAASAWVSANAGSGKTYVLTQRVVRLLLAGTDPAKILCLTFTRTAAAEMSNRVFALLAKWAVMDDAVLDTAVAGITGNRPGSEARHEARRLFARALDTPGGLKIQTIHGFCESILHQFPLEANVSGHFEVMDDFARDMIAARARENVLRRAAGNPNSDLNKALATILSFASETGFVQALDDLLDKREAINSWRRDSDDNDLPRDLCQTLDIDPDGREVDIVAAALGQGLDPGFWRQLAQLALQSKSKTDREKAQIFAIIAETNDPCTALDAMQRFFMTAKGTPRVDLLSKKFVSGHEFLEQEFAARRAHFASALERRNTWLLATASQALLTVGIAILDEMEGLKQAQGLLDFSDLIARTAELLASAPARQWVRYKLDHGIDHVLVDEAQDTSPGQWQIVNGLIDEFFAGESAHRAHRTMFAVGDEKQSIYSFQGAEPDAFDAERRRLAMRVKAGQGRFEDVRLHLSFRSVPDVLSAVDKVFAQPQNVAGLSRVETVTVHQSIRPNDPGVVEIWPVVSGGKRQINEDWAAPFDATGPNDPAIVLARRIAETIVSWIDKGSYLVGHRRKLRYGDILILLRKRPGMLTALTRALKDAGLPTAGADRIGLTDHIAIQDLIALGKFCLMPDDDLTLAAVLKSPLFGISEEALFEFAYEREASLLAAIEQRAPEDAKCAALHRQLQSLIGRSCRLKPYEFYQSVLGTDDGRRKFHGRLGSEADDVIEAFLSEAINHERGGPFSLETFLLDLQSAKPQIKREIDAERDEIRILTVHGAKGLEAPVVFLVDPCTPPFTSRFLPQLLTFPRDRAGPQDRPPGLLWRPDKSVANTQTRLADETQIRGGEEEYNRLLYVAMTRAADQLIVCGYSRGQPGEHRYWHRMVSEALVDEAEISTDVDGNVIAWRWQRPNARSIQRRPVLPADKDHQPPVRDHVAELPSWITAPLAGASRFVPPLTATGANAYIQARPFRAESEDLLAGSDRGASGPARRGIAIHRLFEILPQLPTKRRQSYASAYLQHHLADLNQSERNHIADTIIATIDNPPIDGLFAAGSQSEVPIAGKLSISGQVRVVNGVIDRLVVGADNVAIVDFKSGHHIAGQIDSLPDEFAVQMALYRALVAKIYPHKPIRCYILWTRTGTLMELPTSWLEACLTTIDINFS